MISNTTITSRMINIWIKTVTVCRTIMMAKTFKIVQYL